MKYFWGFFGFLWSKRKFFIISLLSALFFFAWFFPFSDLSDLVTSAVARGTGNQVYLQFETLDLNFLPAPAISARNVSVETHALPALEAKWMKLSPSWMNILMNLWTIKKASSGDAEAAGKLGARIGVSVAAEGLLGADVELKVRPGTVSDQGVERSKVSLAIEKLNLAEFQKWSDLPLKISGQASFDTTMQITPGFMEQPEGDVELHVAKFNLPAATVMIPYEGAVMPMSLPQLTLANLILRGRLVGGKFIIEEGTFGQAKDPIHGRIKGTMGVKLQSNGQSVQPFFGAYQLTVDLNTTKAVEKDIGVAFFLFQSAKTTTPSGYQYLFQASGNGLGPVPNIVKVPSF